MLVYRTPCFSTPPASALKWTVTLPVVPHPIASYRIVSVLWAHAVASMPISVYTGADNGSVGPTRDPINR